MKRRSFLQSITWGSGALLSWPVRSDANTLSPKEPLVQLQADLVIAGAGLGGLAAALAALRNKQTVILTEETDWIGGQVSQQGVPPDEHQWIETHGATALYRHWRNRIRNYYRQNYPLTEAAQQRPLLNPGDGAVSRLCHEPKVAVAVFMELLAPHLSNGKLQLLLQHKAVSAEKNGNRVHALLVKDQSGVLKKLIAPYFVDATELGDLLPITGTEYRTGTEAKSQTGELHAPGKADPLNSQSFTMCFAMDYVPGENHTIPEPPDYAFWKNYSPDLQPAWPGRLLDLQYSDPRTGKPKQLGFHPEGIATGDRLNLWNYRRIISKDNFKPGTYAGDITIVNWPQNDYMLGTIIDVPEKEKVYHINRAKQLSLSLLYWLQTEVPRPDGGKGWPGIRLRKDVMGTHDGLAKYPYVREARRIEAVFTVKEEHVGMEQRRQLSADASLAWGAAFEDSVGIGYYPIDLHPTNHKVNYVDFNALPFQIPLGALIPIRMENLLPANKNIGTTHITNGCYRLHPVEWSIGEAVGCLVAFAKEQGLTPRQVRELKIKEFQSFISSQGIETAWPL
ncbi:FAD-dependent oxidoreductase [Flavihumibacter sp. CACIAM 22H1]|uniref:FAD-dependent oxidoreductase n=1 Tax=Flavihumibacter sp. CACIAM 22H1 TaxID=1812911 RepID=UPI0007A8371C|nr:FAD-dependent oxidoreductase [Flavihumibacter sp. CACIAM 22H1]KYP15339.1 MAG: FAD-dependent oxidoreductase [Flavihumibacter sp. CACIAM 22H1]